MPRRLVKHPEILPLSDILLDALNPKEVIGKLGRAILQCEKLLLEPFARAQIQAGRVAVVNRYHQFEGMYRYFRTASGKAFDLTSATPPVPTSPSPDSVMQSLADTWNTRMQAGHEAFYNCVAMIDAYFSRLEHTLILYLPFVGFDSTKEDLVKLIGSLWSDKYRRVVGIKDAGAKTFFDELDSVKERYRNTFSHGGFEKAGASLYVQLPGGGFVPASMTNVKKSPHFALFPVEQSSFTQIVDLFDRFDAWLANRWPRAATFVSSSLDVHFDPQWIQLMQKKSKRTDTFEKWSEETSRAQDIYENADY